MCLVPPRRSGHQRTRYRHSRSCSTQSFRARLRPTKTQHETKTEAGEFQSCGKRCTFAVCTRASVRPTQSTAVCDLSSFVQVQLRRSAREGVDPFYLFSPITPLLPEDRSVAFLALPCLACTESVAFFKAIAQSNSVVATTNNAGTPPSALCTLFAGSADDPLLNVSPTPTPMRSGKVGPRWRATPLFKKRIGARPFSCSATASVLLSANSFCTSMFPAASMKEGIPPWFLRQFPATSWRPKESRWKSS